MSPGESFTELPALVDPRVSIVVNNHDYGRFLERAIASAVNQSRPCQVIVVDDGSTDESDAVLARWEGRVRVERRPHGGQAAAYNAGFACCDGDIVIFLDADDTLAPHAAETLAKSFGAGIAKVHFRMSLIDADGRALGGAIPAVLARGEVGAPLLRSGLLYASAPGSGNAYRQSVLARLFPLPASLEDPVGADFFTIYGSGLLGRVGAIDQPLASYRVHHTGAHDAPGVVFGNAAQAEQEAARALRRRAIFRTWMAERTGGAILPPERLTDFSELKGRFVQALSQHRGWARFAQGASILPALLETLWLQSERSVALRAGLTVWSLAALALPHRAGAPLVRYGANPAARGSLRSAHARRRDEAGSRAA